MARSKSKTGRTKAKRTPPRKAAKPAKAKAPRKSKSAKPKRKASASGKPSALKPATRPLRAPKPLPGTRRGLRRRPVAPQPRMAPGRTAKQSVSAYDLDLDRTPANFQPLTPLSFLARTANAHPDVVAIIHGGQRITYAAFYARSRRLASALANEGIGRGDTVSVLLANTPAMLEAHHGVPMTQGVLNSINTRLDAASIAFMLDHAEAKIFIVDLEFAKTAQAALEMLEVDKHGFDEIDRRLLMTIIEKYQGGPVGLNTLAAALAEEADAIEEIYEPFLIQIGFLDRTQRGRVATQLAYEHFGLTPPRKQNVLF